MFEKIKEKFQEKIERNSIKSTLTYANKKGIKLMKKDSSLREVNLPRDCRITEEVIFKRSLMPLGDWGRIYAPVDEHGKLNITNFLFGGWRNFIKLIFVLLIISMFIFQFYNDMQVIETLRTANEVCGIDFTNLG